MRKALFRIAGLALTLSTLAAAAPKVQAQEPICPFCIIGYTCCIQGSQARCIPETRPCP